MSKVNLELQIEITFGDVVIERIIAHDTTLRVADESIKLTPQQVYELYTALKAYVKADSDNIGEMND